MTEQVKPPCFHYFECPTDQMQHMEYRDCHLTHKCKKCGILQGIPSDKPALQVWKDTVIEALVVAGILTEEHETNPRKALHDLICWENAIALDPCVSTDARKLQESGNDALKEANEKLAAYLEELSLADDKSSKLYERLFKSVKKNERLRKALVLAELKIDQYLQGQYTEGQALGAALQMIREALTAKGQI